MHSWRVSPTESGSSEVGHGDIRDATAYRNVIRGNRNSVFKGQDGIFQVMLFTTGLKNDACLVGSQAPIMRIPVLDIASTLGIQSPAVFDIAEATCLDPAREG